VHWEDAEKQYIVSVFSKIDVDHVGANTLERVLIVFPWTKRYFNSFGDLSSPGAIKHNNKVSAHGRKVLAAIIECTRHFGNIKGHLANLSHLHSEKLHVDPHNFRVLGQCLRIELAAALGFKEFTPERNAYFQKFMDVISHSLGREYH
uniref:Hemoglobin subunit beta n=1 Tax=Lepidosiren paradoxus TaxID=7883 RepID=HBB_LEPPA|nr:RecName: Full=Hemoglobin subunit beta; AltName: Full=Beta-globin; AltName: Full=Hemoglobin beta chain [Lepidosiren paradoxa]